MRNKIWMLLWVSVYSASALAKTHAIVPSTRYTLPIAAKEMTLIEARGRSDRVG